MKELIMFSELNLDFNTIIFGAFILMAVFIAGYEIIGKFSVIIKKPLGKYKQQEDDHQLLITMAQNVIELQNCYTQLKDTDVEIRRDIKNLAAEFVDKQIDDMRYEILDFASAISLGRNYTKEQYMHTIKITDKYHQIISEKGLENGQAEISTKIIKDSFEEKLRSGKF